MSEDINVGGMSEALNNKADRDLNNLNIPDNIDYVIERGGVPINGTENGRVVG